MALHILNCSVDTPDCQPENIPEDLTYNDMESVVEILLEQVLGINNAIAETDDNDTDGDNGLNLKKGQDFYFYQIPLKTHLYNNLSAICKHALYKEKYSEQFHPELVTPPPKA